MRITGGVHALFDYSHNVPNVARMRRVSDPLACGFASSFNNDVKLHSSIKARAGASAHARASRFVTLNEVNSSLNNSV